jgi:acetyl-CoA carboxylase carboxyltransferase component
MGGREPRHRAVVTLCLGSVAGLGSARVTDYSGRCGTSRLFVAGPPVVARLGEHVDKEELGGSEIHGRNGASTTWSTPSRTRL